MNRRKWVARVLAVGVVGLTLGDWGVGAVVWGQATKPVAAKAGDKAVPIAVIRGKSEEWFKSEEGARVVGNILTYQHPSGGWHKNYDTRVDAAHAGPGPDESKTPSNDKSSVWDQVGTIDNDATYSELRVLAKAIRVVGKPEYRAAFDRGIGFLLTSQYPNGGWPQRYPLQKNYGRHITYNDDAMVGVMRFMRDVAEGKGDFAFVSDEMRVSCRASFDKGVECILKTQVVRDGKLTAWCQQHDEVTLAPTNARSYELPALCSSESAGIVLLLMEIEKPSDEVKKAVEGAVAWFEKTKIEGKYYARLRGPEYENGYDRKLVDDGSAVPVWPRFADLATDKPMFVDRDGSIHWDVAELGYGRRTGYSWYSTTANKVLNGYTQWKMRVK